MQRGCLYQGRDRGGSAGKERRWWSSTPHVCPVRLASAECSWWRVRACVSEPGGRTNSSCMACMHRGKTQTKSPTRWEKACRDTEKAAAKAKIEARAPTAHTSFLALRGGCAAAPRGPRDAPSCILRMAAWCCRHETDGSERATRSRQQGDSAGGREGKAKDERRWRDSRRSAGDGAGQGSSGAGHGSSAWYSGPTRDSFRRASAPWRSHGLSVGMTGWTHCREMHACFAVPFPPNLGLSRHAEHLPPGGVCGS